MRGRLTARSVGVLADSLWGGAGGAGSQGVSARVRSLGIGHVFVADHVSFHGGFGTDGLIRAAAFAGLDDVLPVHVGVFLLALRHPVLVARQVSSYCESFPGRLVLGVGVGGEDRHEIEICGVDPRTRGRRTDDCLRALRGLLTGEPFSYDSEFFSFTDAWIRPAPDPPVPIVIGGRSDAAIRRAGRLGDGWLGVWCSPRRFAEALGEVESAGSGREVAWRHGLQIWVGLDSDRTRARDRLARRMESMYRIPFERFAKYSPAGTPEAVAEFLAPYAEAGARDFNVMAVAESSEAAIDGVGEIREHLAALVP